MTQLPQLPGGLTAPWLTEVLKAQGVLDEGEVTAVEIEQVGDGSGMMSELCRVRLTYSPEAQPAPATMIAKYPSQNPTNRATAMSYNLYEREVRYFAELEPLTSAHSPATFHTQLDGDNFIILMEDMADYRVGDQRAGADLEETTAMLDELAKLHATFWNDTDALSWVPRIANSYHADNMTQLCEIGWPNMCANFEDYLDPSISVLGDAFQADLARLQTLMDTPPSTLLHGDFRMENVFFGQAPEHHPIAIIDWQGPLRGRGMVDVALMLGQSTRTDVRRSHERALIARYAEHLASSGVEDYPEALAWQDYELAMLYNWVYVSVVAGTLDVHNERAFAWMSQMVARQSAASLDLDIFRLMH